MTPKNDSFNSANKMLLNSLIFLFVLTKPLVKCKPHDVVKITITPEPLGQGWYRHWFSYGDLEVEDEQVGIGTGYVYYLSSTERYFNFSYPGPNRMRNIITYVEGEFITDTDYVEVLKTEGSLWERFIRFQVYAKNFHYFNFQLVAWAVWEEQNWGYNE